MLLYINDENDVRKSWVIQIIEFEYELLQWKNEILLMIFIDDSVYNIDECTIYNVFVINFFNHMWDNINFHMYSLLWDKIIMIIDKISMISLILLHIINQQCNRIWAFQQNFTVILNDFSIIIFFDDFYQFFLIKIQLLWQILNAKISDVMIN